MLDYSKYTTENPLMVVDRDILYESRGIPNILKEISANIYNDVKSDNIKHTYDYDLENFNVSLYVEIFNSDISEIYAKTTFGIYSSGKLKGSNIHIYLDKKNHSEIELKRVITHELLHVYEVFNRIKGGTKKDLQFGLNNVLIKIRNKYKSESIKELIFLIYLSLDQEINARVSETYTILIENRTDNKDILTSKLKETSAWKYSEKLLNFDSKKLKYDDELLNFFIELNIEVLKKYKNLNFNIYKIPSKLQDAKKIVKSWNIIFKKKGNHFQEKLLKIVDEVINDVKLIESAHIDSKYLLKFDKFLLRESNINKLLRI